MSSAHRARHVVAPFLMLAATVSQIAVGAGVAAELRSGAALQPAPSAGQTLPSAPAGGQGIGTQLWTCDAREGYAPAVVVTPGVADPVLAIGTTGNVRLPISPTTTPATCGEVAYDGNGHLYVTQGVVDTTVTPSVDRGVLRLPVDPATGTPVGPGSYIATTAGLDGDQPTAAAIGPDGDLYVAFLKSGNVKRILNPGVGTIQVVQSVGSTPSGHPGRSLSFLGRNLYIGSADAFSVIRNATSTACTGGCNAVPIADGFNGLPHVGVVSDGLDNVYFAVSNQVWRYSESGATFAFVSQGGATVAGAPPTSFSFVPAKSNLLTLDSTGNLWIGDDTSNAASAGTGRLWSIPQATLAGITGASSIAGTNVPEILATLHGPWITTVDNITFEPTFNTDGTFTSIVESTSGGPITNDSGTWTLTPPNVVQPLGNAQAHLAIVDSAGTTLLAGDVLLLNVDQLLIETGTQGFSAAIPVNIASVVLTKFAP